MKCIYCGADNDDQDKFCRSCGSPLTSNDQKEDEEIVYCSRCGAKNKASSTFCVYCGYPLRQDEEPVLVKPKKSKKKYIIIALCALIIIAGGIGGYFYFNKDKKTNSYSTMIAKADEYLENEDYEQAIASYLEAIKIEPKEVKPYLQLADIYVSQEDYTSAFDILDKAKENIGEDNKEINAKYEEIQQEYNSYSLSNKDIDYPYLITKSDDTYVLLVRGFDEMEIAVTIDYKFDITCDIISHNESPGFGKDLIEGESTSEVGQEFYNTILNDIFTESELDGIDASTGATLTTTAIKDGIKYAISLNETTPTLESKSDDTYVILNNGFGLMKIEVTIEGENITCKVLENSETAGFGKDLIEGESTSKAGQAFYNTILNNSFNEDDLDGIDTSTGATLTATGIKEAIEFAIELNQ